MAESLEFCVLTRAFTLLLVLSSHVTSLVLSSPSLRCGTGQRWWSLQQLFLHSLDKSNERRLLKKLRWRPRQPSDLAAV